METGQEPKMSRKQKSNFFTLRVEIEKIWDEMLIFFFLFIHNSVQGKVSATKIKNTN